MSITRNTDGFSSVQADDPMAWYSSTDPTAWHTCFDDFNHFDSTDEWTVAASDSGTAAVTDEEGGVLLVTCKLNTDDNSVWIKKGMSESVIDDPKKTNIGYEIIFNKKFSHRWQLIASYHYSKSKGNTDSLLTNIGGNCPPKLRLPIVLKFSCHNRHYQRG